MREHLSQLNPQQVMHDSESIMSVEQLAKKKESQRIESIFLFFPLRIRFT